MFGVWCVDLQKNWETNDGSGTNAEICPEAPSRIDANHNCAIRLDRIGDEVILFTRVHEASVLQGIQYCSSVISSCHHIKSASSTSVTNEFQQIQDLSHGRLDHNIPTKSLPLHITWTLRWNQNQILCNSGSID